MKRKQNKTKTPMTEEELAAFVLDDYEKRKKERIDLERQWDLNRDFYEGRQYRAITKKGDLVDLEREFFWQERGVFNHVAPIIDARLSKLELAFPSVAVRPSGSGEKEVKNADTATRLIEDAFEKQNVKDVVGDAIRYGEICGTAFYKVAWNEKAGAKVGEVDGVDVYEGDVSVQVVSPYEIFPDDLSRNGVDECQSILHVRKMSEDDILALYGVAMRETENPLNVRTPAFYTVIERYEAPTKAYPEGRLITACENRVLYVGSLPYITGKDGKRGFPFVRELSTEIPNGFFGRSVIEHLIPVQRAFNAVKNRKHEFINRLTTGVLTVEDGSVDLDNLLEEGLSPGKVVVYRQGSKVPEMMKETTLPAVFGEEEEKLLREFVIIGGVSDVASTRTNTGVSSGAALEILVEQDTERLLPIAEEIRSAVVEVATLVLRLYRQFTTGVRAVRVADEKADERYEYVDKSALPATEAFACTDNALLSTPKQKKETLLKIYQAGLFADENGITPLSTKKKILKELGYTAFSEGDDEDALQQKKAEEENARIRAGRVERDVCDDDAVHEKEHIKYYLSAYGAMSESERANVLYHVALHQNQTKKEIV